MFEREIQFITDFNLNKIRRLGSFFTLENLSQANVHPAIVHYVSAELDYLLYLDRQRILKTSVFDYSGPVISDSFQKIGAEIKKHKLLPFEDIKRLVLQAVTFNVNYLLRPRWTLVKFVFDVDETRNIDELRLFLQYAYFYEYYKKIIAAVIDKRKILTIGFVDFNELLDDIQRELLNSQLQSLIDNGLYSIAEFLNIGETNKTKLAVGTVEVFLRDKELHDHIYKVRRLLTSDQKQKFELEDFRTALFSDVPAQARRRVSDTVFMEGPGQSLIREQIPQNQEKLPFPDDPTELKELQDKMRSINVVDDKRKISLFGDKPETFNKDSLADTVADILKSDFDSPRKTPTLEIKEEKVTADDLLDFVAPESSEDFKIDFDKPYDFDEDVPEINKVAEDTIIHEPTKEEKFSNISEEEQEFATSIEPEEPSLKLNAEIFADETPATETDSTFEEQPIEINLETKSKIQNEVPAEKFEEEKANAEPIIKGKFTTEKTKVDDEVFDYFSAKETEKIVQNIFNGDSVDFANSLERIAECSSFDSARELLNSVFLTYKINPISAREAILLNEKILQYFNDRK